MFSAMLYDYLKSGNDGKKREKGRDTISHPYILNLLNPSIIYQGKRFTQTSSLTTSELTRQYAQAAKCCKSPQFFSKRVRKSGQTKHAKTEWLWSKGEDVINPGNFPEPLQQYQISLMENSQEFQPENYSEPQEEQYKPPKKAQKYVSGAQNGIWSHLQHTKYIVFMEYHKDKMRSKEKRRQLPFLYRTNKLYKAMAQYIGTRNALQCRSHHQKLQEKYVYPNKIIAHYKQHNDITLYNELKQKIQEDDSKRLSNSTSDVKQQDSNLPILQEKEHSLTEQVDNTPSHSNPTLLAPFQPEMRNTQQYPMSYVSWQPNLITSMCPLLMYPIISFY